MSKFMFDRPAVGGNIADLAEKYSPRRVLAPGLIPTLVPETREEPVLASEAEVAAAPVAEVAPDEGILKIGDVTAKYDPETNTYVDLATGRRAKELVDLLNTEETFPGDPARGKYRGGRVQAFKKGGKASIADMARHYGTRR